MTFPFVLIASFALIFLSIYVYEKGALYHTASLTAERAAYTWNNSNTELVTGAFPMAIHDGLYWRTFQDNVSGMFPFFTEQPSSNIGIPADLGKNGLDLPQRKLLKASSLLPKVEAARLSYAHHLFDRTVSVQIDQSFQQTGLVQNWLSTNHMQETAKYRVIDPVEFIRMIDFARLYASNWIGILSPRDAVKLYTEPDSLKVPLQFEGHDKDLLPYVQTMVNGKAVKLNSLNGSKREIDALDKSGVAHQAICTFTNKNLLESQMPKDVYLLKEGSVKGVVWHFFTNCRGKQPKPSTALVQQLQRNGIVVIIHNPSGG